MGFQAYGSRTWLVWAAAIRTNGTVFTLDNPRAVVPESNMPGFPWLKKNLVDPAGMAPRMKALRLGWRSLHR